MSQGNSNLAWRTSGDTVPNRIGALRYWNIGRQRYYRQLGHVATPCASLPTAPPAPVRTPAENPGFSTKESKLRRETDCLLEGDGFELSVPVTRDRLDLERFCGDLGAGLTVERICDPTASVPQCRVGTETANLVRRASPAARCRGRRHSENAEPERRFDRTKSRPIDVAA